MKALLQYRIGGRRASQIAASVEAGVREGRIPPGAPLPPVRALAEELGVSPATVAAAYRELRVRGLVSAAGRRGTRVSPRPPLRARASSPVPENLRNLAEGNPDPSLLPPLGPALARVGRTPRLYGAPVKHPELVRIARAQLGADGVDAENLAVVGGAMEAVERVLQAHLRPGDRVAVEDPAYTGVLDLLAALGLVAEPVAIDDAGPLPLDLQRALRSGVAALIVTPRAQNPTGAALDERRARELRRVLESAPDLLVVEDDHAGPVAGVPALSLSQGRRRWALVRSVSKSLGPDLRLSVVAGDLATVARVEGRQLTGAGWVSHLLQDIVVACWSDPAAARRLQAAADAYAARRARLIDALAARGLAAQGRSGLNVWVPVPEELRVVTALAADGWAVKGGEPYRLKSPPAVRITISCLAGGEADAVAAALARSLGAQGRTLAP